MKKRSLLPLVLGALLALTTATLSVTVSSASAVSPVSPSSAVSAGSATELATRAAAPAPGRDFPRMPRRCATPKEKIPSKPIVCELNGFDRNRPSVVLWGDSHAWMFIPALKKAVGGRDINLVAVVMGSCPPMDNQVRADDPVPACFRSNALALDLTRRLEASGERYRLVLAGSWQRYVHARKVGDRRSYVGMMAKTMRAATPRLARTLNSIGAEVDVIGQVATVPERIRRCPQGNDPYACQVPVRKALPEATATKNYVRTALGPVLDRNQINVNPFFCTSQVCKGLVDGVRTWFDDLHLSATRSASLAPYFEGVVDAVAPPLGGGGVDPTTPGCELIVFC